MDGTDTYVLQPNITFADSFDPKIHNLYYKAFCVNPPDNECPFGIPCPNSDVTGIGQQISIYITTIIYGVVLAYIPWLQRPMLYAHLSVIYSLLIAGLVSILKGELVLSDGIFVIVTVASPATLYLWYLSIKSFWNMEYFPIEHANKNVPASKSVEVHVCRIVSLLSLVFTVVMICLVFTPNIKGINFPQSACNKIFGTANLWYNIAWEIPFAIQSCAIFLTYFLAWGVTWLWTRRSSYETPPLLLQPHKVDVEMLDYHYGEKPRPERRQALDLISWTERILFDEYPNFMNRTLFVCIVAILQISALPYLQAYVQTKDALSLILLAYGLFREAPGPRGNATFIWGMRVLIFAFSSLLFIMHIPMDEILGVFNYGTILPIIPDWIFLFLSITTAKWSWKNFSGSNMKVFLTILNVFIGVITVVLNIFAVILADPKLLNMREGDYVPPDGSIISILTLNFVTVGAWIIAWISTSAWPWHTWVTWHKFNKGLWKRAHLLKLFWVVIGPHMIWIQASNNTNTSRPMDMTFGQIFAVIVSGVTVVTLLDEAKDVKKNIWLSVLKSDSMYYEEVEQPKHYAPRPGLGMS